MKHFLPRVGIIQIKNIEMGYSGHPKSKRSSMHRDQTYQQKLAQLKETFFLVANAHLSENEQNSPFLYYLCLLLEHLALLWYVLHPGLNIFADVYLLPELRMGLQILNFQELILGQQELYKTVVGVILGYLACQMVLLCVSVYSVLGKSTGEFAKYLKKIVNFQLIFNVKVAAGPILGVAVNVFYCQPDSPYHVGGVCYEPVHIVFCVLCGLIVLLILAQVLVFGTFYFIKNPLSASYMGDYSRYYTLSKALIKVLLPVYFAVDYTLSLSLVYVFMVTALLGIYVGWHRLFSIHSYQQDHFYIEYFMESVVLWMAVNNILSYYIEGATTSQPMSLVYAFFSAGLIGVLLMNIEKTAENQFVQECLERRVKKQSMERFVFILINRFLHEPTKEARLTFKVYSKIISKNIERYKEIEERLCEGHQQSDREEVYHFLCVLIESCLEENSSVILKTLKCYLLCYLGQKSFGLHQSLELQEERLSIADEFMLYEFKINQNVFGNERAEKFSIEFVKYYRFHEELGELEELIELCAQNNMQYWQQLCEGDPSIAKLRNLATLYNSYEGRIAQQYAKVIAVFPQNLYSTTLYLKFLLNVGVDTKEALKVKEKMGTIMEARSRSVRVSQSQFSEDEDVAIITVDSIGNNLGVVLNCNNNVQMSLGFDRNGLIGKNVTKIMPKIYSELHNNFMLHFIRSETSHLRPSDKIVTALNKDALLVEMKLTVRMMTSSQSALAIVGFMKQLPKEKGEAEAGLLMFSLSTSEILAIDAQFEKLMNYKLSGKQLVQEEIKLASIMPELNLELLEKERSVRTVLEVGNANEQDEIDIEVTKPVTIELKSTKLYEGINIGFLSITEDKVKAKEKFNSLVEANTPSYRKLTKVRTPELLGMLGSSKKQTSQDEASINLRVSDKGSHGGEDGLARELPMAKKMEEYVLGKENTRVKGGITFIQLLTVLGCAAFITYIYLSHRATEAQMVSMYAEMKTVGDMSYYVSRVNLLSSLIWSSQNSSTQVGYDSWVPVFSDDFSALKKTFNSLVKITNQYDLNLEYNQLNNYSYWYITSVNGGLLTNPVYSTNMNLFNSYIEASGQFLYTNFTDAVETASLQIQSQFIRINGDEILPNITDNAVLLYQGYFNSVVEGEFHRMAGLETIVLASSIVIVLLVSFIGRHINKINREVVEIYKTVRLWDVAELSGKCSDFLTAKGCKVNKRRNSSLLRIFPVKTFLEIIAEASKGKNKDSRIGKASRSKESRDKPLIVEELKAAKQSQLSDEVSIREVMSPDPLLTPALFTPAEPAVAGFMDNEETLLKGTEVEPTVQMYWQSSSRCIVIGIVLIVLVIGGAVGLSILALQESKSEAVGRIQVLQEIGELRKIVNFINYLSFRTIQNPTDTAARGLLNQYIGQFYDYSSLTSAYLGDPQPVLKGVYTYVQTIQQWLAQPDVAPTNILLANFPAIYQGLKSGSDGIDQLNASLFAPQYGDCIASDQQTQLEFAVTLFLMICAFVVGLDRLYLQPICRQSKHSLNMVKILPAWVFQRNPRALEHLLAEAN